jgi:hypothetical protein
MRVCRNEGRGQCKRRWQRSLIFYCGIVCLFLGGPDFMGRMRAGLHGRMPTTTTVDDRYEQRRRSIDGGSSMSSITTTISTADGLLISEQMLLLGDGDTSSFRHNTQVAEDALVSSASTSTSSSSDGSSPPLGWPLGRADHPSGEPSPSSSELNRSRDPFIWEQKREKRQTVLSEVELMKERFAKLLLGDDMSGGAKGVCTALAISNAITNLSGNAGKCFQCTSTSHPLKD